MTTSLKTENITGKKTTVSDNSSGWHEKPFRHPGRKIHLATMFSGIGAIEYALSRLGLSHEIIFASDNDPSVKKSYFANYKISPDRWYDDVHLIKGKKYRHKIDLLVGGSPCQSFSLVGNRSGLDDARGTLFFEFARVIKESRPKVFIFENVKGLINHDKGKTFKVISAVFDELNYDIHTGLLNAKNYGIPQNRERLFIIGFRKNSDFSFPPPVELKHTMQDFLEDYTDSKYYLKEKGVKFVTSSKNRKKQFTQINGPIALCQKANQQFNWHGDFIYEHEPDKTKFDEFIFDINDVEEKYYLSEKVKQYVLSEGTKNFKIATDINLNIARPILQSMHKMHRAGVDNYVDHHRGKLRKLTPRECLRLMGFRDDFKIEVADTQMYRQAGNSIVVDVLIALLKQMDITLFGRK